MNRDARGPRHHRPSCLGLAIVLLLGLPADADDWSQFGRDRTRNAVSPERNAPTNWSFGRRADAEPTERVAGSQKNIKWSARLGSQTYGDPVVVDGLVWVGTNAGRDQRDASVLACFLESDGKLLYRYISPRLPHRRDNDWPNASLACSPLIEGDRMWFMTNRAEVVCLDIGPLKRNEGLLQTVWKVDLMVQYGVYPSGSRMALMRLCSIGSYRDLIYVATGNGANADDHFAIPAPDAPSLLCLRKDNGDEVWQDKSPEENILDGQWSSPTVVEVGTRAQCIVGQGDGWVRSFDALTGEPIWQFDMNHKESKWSMGDSTRHNVVASPVFADGRVYVAKGQYVELASGTGRLVCIDPTRQGDTSSELAVDAQGKLLRHRRMQAVDLARGEKAIPNPNSGLIWEFEKLPDGKPYEDQINLMAGNVAVHKGLLIACDREGFVHCFDAKTGRRHWVCDLEDAIYGSPLIVDDKVYVACEQGSLSIFALSSDPNRATQYQGGVARPLRQTEKDTVIHCSPIFANGALYVATNSQLFAIAEGSDKPDVESASGYWPQWRGARRDNVSDDRGLLSKWPDSGPPRLWTAKGVGDGIASVSIAGGKIFTLGYQHESEFAIALDEETGELCWAARLGAAVPENPIMRWLSQRVPTVDDERVYAFTSGGDLICLQTADGKELWRKNYTTDFGAKHPIFGFYEQPLVDGDLLICTPGGSKGQLAFLDKRTGEVRQMAGGPSTAGSRRDYVATTVAEVAGVRQYVTFLDQQLTGIAADDGRVLWRYEHLYRTPANSQTPILRANEIFCSSQYSRPAALLKLARKDSDMTIEQVYQQPLRLELFQDSTTLVGEHLYISEGSVLGCLDWRTGAPAWRGRLPGGRFCFTCADGHLYVRGADGRMHLVEATTRELVTKGSFGIPDHVQARGSTLPVVAGGRLYLREESCLHCYDVRANRPAGAVDEPRSVAVVVPPPPAPRADASQRRPPNGVFVPTPHDVVRRMLELAQPTKTDVVCDLGCGDGRIVIVAARQFGCRAVGYDIDGELVALARQEAAKEGVEKLVTIDRADVLTVDLSQLDVVTVYLLPEQIEALIPRLQKMKPGARILSHQFPLKGMKADHTEVVKSEESGEEHTIYLYKLPLTAAD